MQNKYSMYFRMKTKHTKTGEIAQFGGFPLAQACWAALTLRGMDDAHRLHELEWHFEKGDGVHKSTVEEVRQMIEYFFPEDQRYGITIEFSGDSPMNAADFVDAGNRRPNIGIDRSVVTFSNLGDYPKYLFMNKMFMIRNLNRYCESYGMFNKLRLSGVDFATACVLGATVHQYTSMQGLGCCFRGYAATMSSSHTTPAELRAMALNQHDKHHIGPTWAGEAKGYNAHGDYDGVERTVRFRDRVAGVPSCAEVTTGQRYAESFSWEQLMKLVSAVTEDKNFLTVKEPVKTQYPTVEEMSRLRVAEKVLEEVVFEKVEGKVEEEIKALRNFKARRVRAQKKFLGMFMGAEKVVKINKGLIQNIPKAVKPKPAFEQFFAAPKGWGKVN